MRTYIWWRCNSWEFTVVKPRHTLGRSEKVSTVWIYSQIVKPVASEMEEEDSQMEIDQEEIDLVSKICTMCKNCALCCLFAPVEVELHSCVLHNRPGLHIFMWKKFLHIEVYQALPQEQNHRVTGQWGPHADGDGERSYWIRTLTMWLTRLQRKANSFVACKTFINYYILWLCSALFIFWWSYCNMHLNVQPMYLCWMCLKWSVSCSST